MRDKNKKVVSFDCSIRDERNISVMNLVLEKWGILLFDKLINVFIKIILYLM